MADKQFDLVVIGSGPGGYVAAIRAAQLGMRVACVEARDTLGGTCLNIGCIPSKAMLTASEHYSAAQHHLAGFGVKVAGVSLDLPALLGHKDKVVEANVSGVAFLFKKHKITRYTGIGSLTGDGGVKVTKADGSAELLTTTNILIATGSESMPLPGVTVDEKQIVTSTGALSLERVPERMVVIGGGYIGLEMGSVWQRLGSKVTVVEFLDRILPGMDGECSKLMQRLLGKQGLSFKLSTEVTGAKTSKKGVALTVEPAAGGTAETIEADVVLLAIGRRAYTAGLGLKEAGVELDERGRVKIDKQFRTNVKGVWAIGDVVAGAMLAHKASEEGVACAEIMVGKHAHLNYDAIPGVVYTEPEAASVGATEEQLKQAGVAYKVGKFPFTANGRARAMIATDGFVKILADAKTDRILGAHIVGTQAGSMIHEIVIAMEFGASAEDIGMLVHAHPTLNEAVKEAALGVNGNTIHI